MLRTNSIASRLLDEIPLTLFAVFNAVMLWLVWSLRVDVGRWKERLAVGDVPRVPHGEPARSEAILQGLPMFWLAGAVAIGALAVFWHARKLSANPAVRRALQGSR